MVFFSRITWHQTINFVYVFLQSHFTRLRRIFICVTIFPLFWIKTARLLIIAARMKARSTHRISHKQEVMFIIFKAINNTFMNVQAAQWGVSLSLHCECHWSALTLIWYLLLILAGYSILLWNHWWICIYFWGVLGTGCKYTRSLLKRR